MKNVIFPGKPVFVLKGGGLQQIEEKEIEAVKNRIKASSINFLRERLIGIIVSTKPCQSDLNYALGLKKRLEKKGKRAFIFLANTINIYELENFSCKIWVNAACPGMILDTPKVINLEDAERLLK